MVVAVAWMPLQLRSAAGVWLRDTSPIQRLRMLRCRGSPFPLPQVDQAAVAIEAAEGFDPSGRSSLVLLLVLLLRARRRANATPVTLAAAAGAPAAAATTQPVKGLEEDGRGPRRIPHIPGPRGAIATGIARPRSRIRAPMLLLALLPMQMLSMRGSAGPGPRAAGHRVLTIKALAVGWAAWWGCLLLPP
jgi:hypothetical protein